MIKRLLRIKAVPLGPVLIVTLLGLLLLSAELYYHAVRIQRFLEPALAISQPRIDFAERFSSLLIREFGSPVVKGVVFTTDAVYVDESLFFVGAHHMEKAPVVEKLGRVFFETFNDPEMRLYINRIIIGARLPMSPDPESNKHRRLAIQSRADMVLNSLYSATPELEREFGRYFSSTTVAVEPSDATVGWMEFRIIPTERLHIELLRKLGKYAN